MTFSDLSPRRNRGSSAAGGSPGTPAVRRRAAVVALLLAALVPTTLFAQEFPTPGSKSFYNSYVNLREISDVSGIERLVQSKQPDAMVVLDVLCEQYLRDPSEERLEECRPLAAALDKRQSSSVFAKRLEYLQTLKPEQWEKRFEAFGVMGRANGAFQEAMNKRDQSSYRNALVGYEEALGMLEPIGDLEWISFSRFRLGYCYDQLSEYYFAVVAYDKAMDEWVESGRSKGDVNYGLMVDRRRELIDRGYDPNADPPDPAEMARNTSTSFVADSDWADVGTEYKAMKKFDQFWQPSPWWSPNFLHWHQVSFRYNSESTLTHPSPCEPFGKELSLKRATGAKGMMDVNGDGEGDVEIKIVDGKPTLAVLPRNKERDADRYGLFMTAGQQTMQWLGQQVNYQELAFYAPGSYREGEVIGKPLILIDSNGTGLYGDPKELRDGVLRGYPSYVDLDSMIVGKGKRAGPFSEYFVDEERVYRLKPSDSNGKWLKVREMDVDVGQVKVEWDGPNQPSSLVIREIREFTGGYFDVAGKNPVSVPVGRYEVAVGKIEAGRKSNLQLLWLFKGESKAFDVKKGEVTTIECGGPYTCEFLTDDGGQEFTVKGESILVRDRLGMIVGRFAPDIFVPEVSVRVKGGGTLAKNEEMKLITSEQFNEKQDRAWFPEDFVVKKSASAECEAKLYLKKHPLLGGPIESEWR